MAKEAQPSFFLDHPIGTSVEFKPVPMGRGGIPLISVVSRRSGREDKSFGTVSAHLARAWYKKWEEEGFTRRETKGN